jgi:hypothetical protein
MTTAQLAAHTFADRNPSPTGVIALSGEVSNVLAKSEMATEQNHVGTRWLHAKRGM